MKKIQNVEIKLNCFIVKHNFESIVAVDVDVLLSKNQEMILLLFLLLLENKNQKENQKENQGFNVGVDIDGLFL